MQILKQKTVPDNVFVAALLGLNALMLLKALTAPVIEFDTQRLVAGIPALRDCLSGTAAACRDISYFAPLQQLPALLLQILGTTYDQTLLLLAWINTAALMLVQFVLFRRYFTERKPVVLFFTATVIAGPAMPYITSTFSEGLVIALLTAIVMLFTAGGSATLTGVLFALTAMSKDTAPLWCVLVAVALWLLTRPVAGSRRRLLAAFAGIATGLLIMTGLNILRYDSLFNTFHSQPVFMAESARQVVIQLVAMLLSPNGGFLWFWLVPIMLVLPAVVAIARTDAKPWFLLPLALMAGGLFLSLSLFYTPFGWVAWGSRLNLPWLVAATMIIVAAGSGFTVRKQKRLASVVAVLAALWQLPHAFAALSPAIIMSVFQKSATCPGLVDVLTDKRGNTICMNEYLWPEGPSVLLRSWTLIPGNGIALLTCLAAATVTGFSVYQFLTGTGSETTPAE
jgi:hypothetical protein